MSGDTKERRKKEEEKKDKNRWLAIRTERGLLCALHAPSSIRSPLAGVICSPSHLVRGWHAAPTDVSPVDGPERGAVMPGLGPLSADQDMICRVNSISPSFRATECTAVEIGDTLASSAIGHTLKSIIGRKGSVKCVL